MESTTKTAIGKNVQKCEKVPKDVVVPLEVLFSSPIILKCSKAIHFLEKCHDDTKEDFTMKGFKTERNENANKCEIWPTGKTWEDVIKENEDDDSERKHYQILRTFINPDGTPRKKLLDVDPNSVTDLLGVIRNKYSHKGLLGEDVLKALGWGKEISNKFEFCDEKFLAYWTSRFPKLLPFLWEQYKVPMSDKNPGGAYPPCFKSCYSSCCLFDSNDANEETTSFRDQLSIALSQNLEQGWLDDRFTLGNDADMTVEFRTLETCYLDVDKYNFLEIEITGIEAPKVIRKWYEITNKQITLSEENTISLDYEKVDSSRESFVGTIVICNKLSDLDEYLLKGKCINIFENNYKFIVVTNREHKLDQEAKIAVVDKFSKILRRKYFNYPIKWSDLNTEVQNALVKQVRIKIQGMSIKFEDFLRIEENAGTSNKILSNLYGTELNEVLKTKRIVLSAFDKNSMSPTSSQTYISRKVYSRGNVGAQFFGKSLQVSGSKFIIVHSGKEKVPSGQNIKYAKVNSLNDFRNVNINECKSNVFYVEEPVQNFSKLSITFKCCVRKHIGVHVFVCFENDRFEWVSTPHGSFSAISYSLYKAAELKATNQEKLLNKILKFKRPGDIIFISDEPGMGKTELLMNFAQRIKHRRKKCVLLFEMREIVESIKDNVSRNKIINTITDLSSSDSFCKDILKQLLSSNRFSIEFHMMIDGLDEIQSKHKEVAYDVLKIFQRDIPWIRVWVTGRDYLLEEVRKQLGVLGYRFLPFTNAEQISYLRKFWRKSLSNSSKGSDPPNNRRLDKYAKELLRKFIFEKQTDIAGIPLQCKMIAEIFEEKVLNGDFSLENSTVFGLHNMHDEMLKKKFKIYWAEKQKLSMTTGQEVAETQHRRINRFLVYLSIKLIFSEEKANELRSYLEIPRKKHDLEMLETDILKHGIVQSLSPLRFIHRTFSEFIVASFVTQEVKECLESNENFNSLDGTIEDFVLNDVLATQPFYYYKSFIFHHNNLICFLNMTLKSVLSSIPNTFKKRGITPAYYKLLKIFENLESMGNKKFAKTNDTTYIKLLETSFYDRFKNIGIVLILLSENPLDSLMFTLNNNFFEIVKFILGEMNFSLENWHKVREYDESGSGILHRILKCRKSLQISSFITWAVEKNRSLLEEKDSKGQTPFLVAIKFALQIVNDVERILISNEKVHNQIKRMNRKSRYASAFWIEDLIYVCDDLSDEEDEDSSLSSGFDPKFDEKDVDKVTERGQPLFEYYEVVIKKLVELGVDINTTDNDGNTALHLIFSRRLPYGENYDPVWYIKFAEFFLTNSYNQAHLNQFNRHGSTPLLCFLDNYCSTLNSKRVNICLLTSKHSSFLCRIFKMFEKFGTDFNARDTRYGETILHKAIRRKYNLQIISLIVNHGGSVLDRNSSGQCAIHLAVEYKNTEIRRYLLEICPFLYIVKDNDGKTVRDYELDLLYPEGAVATLFVLSSEEE